MSVRKLCVGFFCVCVCVFFPFTGSDGKMYVSSLNVMGRFLETATLNERTNNETNFTVG